MYLYRTEPFDFVYATCPSNSGLELSMIRPLSILGIMGSRNSSRRYIESSVTLDTGHMLEVMTGFQLTARYPLEAGITSLK